MCQARSECDGFQVINIYKLYSNMKLLAIRNILCCIVDSLCSTETLKNNIMCNNLSCFSKNSGRYGDIYTISDFQIDGHRSQYIERVIVRIMSTWRTSMNLYLHNCRHFSYYARKIAYEELQLMQSE